MQKSYGVFKKLCLSCLNNGSNCIIFCNKHATNYVKSSGKTASNSTVATNLENHRRLRAVNGSEINAAKKKYSNKDCKHKFMFLSVTPETCKQGHHPDRKCVNAKRTEHARHLHLRDNNPSVNVAAVVDSMPLD